MKFVKRHSLLFISVFTITTIVKPVFCFIELGVYLIFLALFSFIISNRIKKKGIQCLGKIVGFKTDGEVGKIPIVQYTTQSGQDIKAQPFIHTSTDLSKLTSYASHFEPDVLIKYDISKPDRFLIIGQKGFNFFFLWLMIVGGLLFLLFGTGALLNYISFNKS